MKKGYIRLWRRIWDNWTWAVSFPKSKAEAWIDLILMAQGTEQKIMIEGQEQILKRGQILTSILALSQRWGWSRNKVRHFLRSLSAQKPPQIGHRKGHNYSIITICNYRLYNPLSEKRTPKSTPKRTAKGQQKDTLNKRINKDKEKPLVRKMAKPYFELVDLLNEKMLENDPKAKIADTEDRRSKWANVFRLLIERDERDLEEVKEILIWCQEDDFWQGNILSAAKFRKQYGQLRLKKNKSQPKIKFTSRGKELKHKIDRGVATKEEHREYQRLGMEGKT